MAKFRFWALSGPKLFYLTFLCDHFVFCINPDGPHPGQNKKKNPCIVQIFFLGFRAKKGQKRHVARQRGSYIFCDSPNAFYFHFIPFDIRNLFYLGGFTAKMSPQKVKKKFRPYLRDFAHFRLFLAFPLWKIFYTTRQWKSSLLN